MKKFKIPDQQFVENYTARYLSERFFKNVLSENNTEWLLYHDAKEMALVAECENRPRDLPIFGVRWENFDET